MPKYGAAEIRNLTKVIESGNFADHPGGFIDRFQKDFAKALKAKEAVAGATAMLLMHALPGTIGAGAGDEIICDPVVQFHGIACLHGNVVPVFADVRPDNFLMDPKSVEQRITKRTRAIWVTHLWGFPAEVDKLRKIADRHGIYLLEDCAHAIFTRYKGRYVGNWGHCGTYSFNMGKQLPTGEGGMATFNDRALAGEMRKRIIFGESPPVLASNYRMTEMSAAIGVEQLKKVPGYLKIYKKGKALLDAVVDDCKWLQKRWAPPGSDVSPYAYACIFRGDKHGVEYGMLKSALSVVGRETGAGFGFGFTQRPAYQYDFFRNPNAYGNVGCPYDCGHYKGKVHFEDGWCPVAEDVIPRIITTSNMAPLAYSRKAAATLRKAIAMVEAGTAPPWEYSREEKAILDIVEAKQPIEPSGVIKALKRKGITMTMEQCVWALEHLRSGFPRKLSHAGPRHYAHHSLA